MLSDVQQVIAALNAFVPKPHEDNTFELYSLLEGFDSLAQRELAIPAMFGLMERYPEADFGSPGPLVHELESLPRYETHLRASLLRRPSLLTLWMANRILNSSLSVAQRKSWLELLQEVAASVTTSQSVRAVSREFLEHQARRGQAPRQF